MTPSGLNLRDGASGVSTGRDRVVERNKNKKLLDGAGGVEPYIREPEIGTCYGFLEEP